MSDARIRKAYRLWRSTGDPRDEAVWIRERLRGGLDPERLRVASLLDHPAAIMVMPLTEALDHPALRHFRGPRDFWEGHPGLDPPGQLGVVPTVLGTVLPEVGYQGRVAIGSAASVVHTTMVMHAVLAPWRVGWPEHERHMVRLVDLDMFLPGARTWLAAFEDEDREESFRTAEDFNERFFDSVNAASENELRATHRHACRSLLSVIQFVSGSMEEEYPEGWDAGDVWSSLVIQGVGGEGLPELCAFNAFTSAVHAWEEWFQGQRGDDFETARRAAHLRVLDSVRREVIPWLLG